MSPYVQKLNNALNGRSPPYVEMLHAVLIPRESKHRDDLHSGFLFLAFAAAAAVFLMAAFSLA